MLRVLFTIFFLAISAKLYLDGRADVTTSHPPAVQHVAHKPPAVKVRTVAAPYKKANEPRRYTSQEDIATALHTKHKKTLLVAHGQTALALKQVAKEAPSKPLDATNKYRIAILIKAELKRLGCYKGTISGSWDNNTQNALAHFNVTVAQNNSITEPRLQTLTQLRSYNKRACRSTNYQIAKKISLPIQKPAMPAPTIASILQTSDAMALATAATAATTSQFNKPRKKNSRRIASLRDDAEFDQTPATSTKTLSPKRNSQARYYYKPKRPPASTVGRRIKRPSVKRKIRAAKIKKRRAKRRTKRRKSYRQATARKHRRIRRRYRRARKRFRFNSFGEIGNF